MANTVDPDQTAPLEQSDLGLHCLPRHICPKTNDLYGSSHVLFSFCRYCSRSCLTMMAGVGVVHQLLKKRNNWYKSLTKPPQLKLFTSSPQGQASKPFPCPNPRPLYFGLKPICLRSDRFGCKSMPSCNCLGGEGKFQSVRVCIRTTWLKRVGSGTPVPSTSLRQVPILVNGDQINVYFIEEGQRGLHAAKTWLCRE